jgi:protein-disulfide isomerase
VSKRVGQKQAARFIREQQARDARRRRQVIVSVVAVAVLLIAGLVGWGVYASQHKDSYTAPATASSQADGLVIGGGPVTVDIYLDFMCPVCKQYEDQAGQTLNQLVADNKIRLVYHPVAFLDRASSGTQYSTRSSASSACASDQGKLAAYVAALYAHQPAEGSNGLTDEQMISIANGAGLTDPSFGQCVKDGKYLGWVTHVTDTATERGVNGTPTVFVAGKQVSNTVAALTAAVNTAAPKG